MRGSPRATSGGPATPSATRRCLQRSPGPHQVLPSAAPASWTGVMLLSALLGAIMPYSLLAPARAACTLRLALQPCGAEWGFAFFSPPLSGP